MAQNTDKIFLAEIADITPWGDYIAFYSHVWGLTTNNVYTNLIHPDFEPENIGLDDNLTVFGVQIRQRELLKVATEAEVIATEGSFYFNPTNRLLLIHFFDNKNPYDFAEGDIKLSLTIGVYKASGEVTPEWNDMQYYPRLLSFPTVEKIKDDFYFSKQVYQRGKVSFDNSDYRFKNFSAGYGTTPKAGGLVRVLEWSGDLSAGTPAYSAFNIIYQGVIDRVRESNKIDLAVDDLRTKLNTKLPGRYIDNSNFTYLKDADKQHLIPWIFGKCYEAPCLCLDENINKGNTAGPFSDYRFLLADASLTGYSDNAPTFDPPALTIASDAIKNVYIDGVEADVTPTVQYDATNEIYYFTLDYELFYSEDDSGNAVFNQQNKVSVTVEGYLDDSNVLIDNGLQIIREILYRGYEYLYNTTYYDTTTWATFEASAYKVGLYLGKPRAVQDIIEDISASQLGEFIYNEDLKFSYNNDDFDAVAATINKYQFFPSDYVPAIEVDPSQVLASFRVGVRKKWAVTNDENGYEWELDETNSENALINFNSQKQRDFKTLLYDATDITNYNNRIHFFGDISNDIIEIKVPWDYRALDKGEYIAVEYDMPNVDFMGYLLGQIQRVKLDIESWQVEIKLRIFKYGYRVFITDENSVIITNENSDRLAVENSL